MLKPLTEFICDHCGNIITSPEKAYLEWENVINENGKYRAKGFKIVHNDYESKTDCAVRQAPTKRISEFTGTEGIGSLLSFYDQGEFVEPTFTVSRAFDLREFTEIFRRITIPYYEEGRQYLTQAFDDDYISSNQYGIYKPDKLQSFIEKYG